MSGGNGRLNLDWFTVRYRSLIMILVMAAGLTGGGWLAWKFFFNRTTPWGLAGREIEAAATLFQEAASYAQNGSLPPAAVSAQSLLAEARALFEDEQWEDSRLKAILSRNNSQQVIDVARSADTTRTEVRFYRINGDVRVRRAGSLAWESANLDVPLRAGDTIKTATHSSAQVIYFDGSVTTLKPGSLVEISKLETDPATRRVRVRESLREGGVKASAMGSKADGAVHEVSTRNSTARAETSGRAEFEVDYDAGGNTTRVSVHEGEAKLSSGAQSVTVKAAERVRVEATGGIGEKEKLLPAPHQIAPGDRKVMLRQGPKSPPAELVWSEVPGASQYRLEVSRQALMAQLERKEVREDTVTSLKGLEDGVWYWRVVALDPEGKEGRFSPVSQFRIVEAGTDVSGEIRPPDLELTEFLQTGNLVIISGRTEPDVTLWVDNQKVDVYEDGSFTAVIRLHRDGRNELEIIAQDPAGNETVARREAYLQGSRVMDTPGHPPSLLPEGDAPLMVRGNEGESGPAIEVCPLTPTPPPPGADPSGTGVVLVPITAATTSLDPRLEPFRSPGGSTPLLSYSEGGDEEELVRRSRSLGFDAHVQGPIPAATLAEIIRRERQLTEASDALRRTREEARREHEKLTHLIDIIKTANSVLEPSRVMEVVMEKARDTLRCELWCLFLVDEARQALVLERAGDGKLRFLGSHERPIGSGLEGEVLRARRPMILNDFARDPRRDAEFDRLAGVESRAVLVVPLISRGRHIGVVKLVNRVPGEAFSPADQSLVTLLMEPAAIALENALLFKRMEQLSVTDDLTGLFNVRYLDTFLQREIKRSQRYRLPMSVVFLDMDGFKTVNDSHGHLAGSQTLFEVGRVLRETVREIDMVTRYGGDEFVIVLPQTDAPGAEVIAERIREAIAARPFLKEIGLEVQLTASLGVATFPDHGRTRDELIHKADAAMYRVKETGKNRVQVAW